MEKTSLQLQERDYRLLADLYKLRVMSTDQIKRLYFKTSKWQIYERLQKLREEGYIQHLPEHLRKKGVQIKSCHYITEKGIRALVDASLMSPNENRRASKNLEAHNQKHLLSLNEIYIEIQGTSWEWLTSREFKVAYNMNRGKKIHGGLRLNNLDYGVYLLYENVNADTILDIHEEMKHNREENFLYRTIIFCKSPEAKERFGSFSEGVATHLLPYSEAGFITLRMMAVPDWVSRLVELKTGQRLLPCTHKSTFAVNMTTDGHLVAELLTQNQFVEDQLYAYSYEHARETGKEVLVLTHTLTAPRLREKFRAYPHVHFLEFDTEDLELISEHKGGI